MGCVAILLQCYAVGAPAALCDVLSRRRYSFDYVLAPTTGGHTAAAIILGAMCYFSAFTATGLLASMWFCGGEILHYHLVFLSRRSRFLHVSETTTSTGVTRPPTVIIGDIAAVSDPPQLGLSTSEQTMQPADTSLYEFPAPKQSRAHTHSAGSSEGETPSIPVCQSHLLSIANQPGATLCNKPCSGKHVEAVFILHGDGSYQHGKRVSDEQNPVAAQLRRRHRVDYANRCAERTCPQSDCCATVSWWR